jgi:lysophospholipase L1-like esterase
MNPTSFHFLRPGEAESLLAAAPWRRLLVLGDSIAVHPGDPVEGYPSRTWADRLADALPSVAYLNLGVSGARAADVRVGQLARGLDFRPDLAVLVAGANDAARRSFAPPAVTADLEFMVSALAAGGALVMTFGCFDIGRTAPVPPEQSAAMSARMRALGRLTGEICRRHGGLHVDFADHPTQAGHPAENTNPPRTADSTLVNDRARSRGVLSADFLHINARGHAVVSTEIIRALATRTSSAVTAGGRAAAEAGAAAGTGGVRRRPGPQAKITRTGTRGFGRPPGGTPVV